MHINIIFAKGISSLDEYTAATALWSRKIRNFKEENSQLFWNPVRLSPSLDTMASTVLLDDALQTVKEGIRHRSKIMKKIFCLFSTEEDYVHCEHNLPWESYDL